MSTYNYSCFQIIIGTPVANRSDQPRGRFLDSGIASTRNDKMRSRVKPGMTRRRSLNWSKGRTVTKNPGDCCILLGSRQQRCVTAISGKLLLFLPHRKVESNNTPQSFFLYFWFGCLGLFGYIRSISPSESIEGIILVSR